MIDLTKEFEQIGAKGVDLYKRSLIDNKRVATGKTKNSIRFEAKTNMLTFYALDHIRDLENGKTAAQVQAEKPFFNQIEDWVEARRNRGDDVPGAKSTMKLLYKYGWNTKLPNRTNPNGGTKGIITNVDDVVLKMARESIRKGTREDILKTLKQSR